MKEEERAEGKEINGVREGVLVFKRWEVISDILNEFIRLRFCLISGRLFKSLIDPFYAIFELYKKLD